MQVIIHAFKTEICEIQIMFFKIDFVFFFEIENLVSELVKNISISNFN